MRIRNIRVLNNYKVKLTNAKLSGVNSTTEVVAEQGTRTPTIPTGNPTITFADKFDIVFKYLMNRYEPSWAVGNTAAGLSATIELLGISLSVNPLALGGTVETLFNGITTSDSGWFDPLTFPRNYATAVRNSYSRFERSRKPIQASHRFVDYQDFAEISSINGGGNMFFNKSYSFRWYPDTTNLSTRMGLTANHNNSIKRVVLKSPYGEFKTPMDGGGSTSMASLPWITNRYADNDNGRFDAYLLSRENTTLRDLLNDSASVRGLTSGLTVGETTDTYLNTMYRGLCYDAGYFSVSDTTRASGGYSADQVLIGSPWIRYPSGITWNGSLSSGTFAGLCFSATTLVMFNGLTFPTNPLKITNISVRFADGISYANGTSRLQQLESLADAWGNSMEFIAHLGSLPYGIGHEKTVPWMVYKDPTVAENVRYFKWRLDASVDHWKNNFVSPIDSYPHVFMEAAADIERTYHQYQSPDYLTWNNITPSGASYVENIPVSWARDQFNNTYGPSGESGAVVGVGGFAWNDFKSPSDTSQKTSSTDSNPKHWSLDSDIASPLMMRAYDAFVGQRNAGTAHFQSIWGEGICGTSDLGEVFVLAQPDARVGPEGYPFFYNSFIRLNSGGTYLEWKPIQVLNTGEVVDGGEFGAGGQAQYYQTAYEGGGGVPWFHDRRFRLFYLYPAILALDGTIVDIMHNGYGYYYATKSGWYDSSLGLIYENNMEARNRGVVVDPVTGRRTPTAPPKNYWTGIVGTSEFELLYACMKGGVTAGLDSLGFSELYDELEAIGATGF